MRKSCLVTGIATICVVATCLAETAVAQIRVGVVGPITGAFAIFGSQISKGAALAVAEINSRGGVNGAKIELITMDDQCHPALATEVTLKLVQSDKVNALIGYPCSGAALAVAGIAAKFDVLMIGLSSVPALTNANRPVLRMIGRDDKLARMVSDYIAANFKNKSLGAVLRDQTPFKAAFQEAIIKREMKLDRVESIAAGASLRLPTWGNQVDALVVQGQLVPSAIPETKTSLIVATNTMDALTAELLKRKNVVVISNPGPDFFKAAPDVARKAGFSDLNNSGYVIYAYAAIQVFTSLAAQSKGDYGGTKLAKIAREKRFETVIGNVLFDSFGDPKDWKFAAYGAASGPHVCETPQCPQYEQCLPCSK